MRYFFISFHDDNGFHNLTCQCETFPSPEALIKDIQETDPYVTEITVISLFEFKNKEDYDSFNNK
jgi:hypothetical protein